MEVYLLSVCWRRNKWKLSVCKRTKWTQQTCPSMIFTLHFLAVQQGFVFICGTLIPCCRSVCPGKETKEQKATLSVRKCKHAKKKTIMGCIRYHASPGIPPLSAGGFSTKTLQVHAQLGNWLLLLTFAIFSCTSFFYVQNRQNQTSPNLSGHHSPAMCWLFTRWSVDFFYTV